MCRARRSDPATAWRSLRRACGLLAMTGEQAFSRNTGRASADRSPSARPGRRSRRARRPMHRRVDQAELDHRAIVLDEARVGRAARRRQRRRTARSRRRSRCARARRTGPAAVRNTSAFDGSHSMRQRVAPAASARAPLDQRTQRFARVAVVEADVEARPRLGGNDVDGLVADIDRGEFEIRRIEMRVAGDRAARQQRGDQLDDAAHRIVGKLADRRRGPACR